MITNETLLHEPLPISLGWLDDSMKLTGPTEENPYFNEDTGSSAADMQEHVVAYEANMRKLAQAVVPAGGFWWQLITGSGPQISKFGYADTYHLFCSKLQYYTEICHTCCSCLCF